MRFSLFGIFLFFKSAFFVKGYDGSTCTGLHVNLAAFIPSGFQYVFKYSSDITLSAIDESHTSLTFLNQTSWSFDNTHYYQSKPIQYLNNIEVVKCPSIDGSCTIKISDSLGLLRIPLSFNNLMPTLNKNLIFDQGTVFFKNISKIGYFYQSTFFNKDSPCVLTDGLSKNSQENNYDFLGMDYAVTVKYCCTQFKDLSVPEPEQICQRLDGNTVFTDKSEKPLAIFSYSVNQYYEFGNNADITANFLAEGYRFTALVNSDAINNCDYYILNSKSCTYTFWANQNIDVQSNLQLSVLSNDFSYPPYGPVFASKIIYRNNLFVKNQNELYTPNNPCWNRTISAPNGITVKNSLCCGKFYTCSKYVSTTNATYSNVNVYLAMEYSFTDTNFILTISSYVTNQKSTVTVKSFSHDTSTQICQASTTGPYNVCNLKLSKTQTYDLTFNTTITTGDFPLETIVFDGTRVIEPPVERQHQCQKYFNNYSQTQFCCIL